MLRKFPITQDSYHEDPWSTWLDGELLTRDDRYWLSDGRDATPRDVISAALEHKKTGIRITGDRKRLLKLLNVQGEKLKKKIVLQGGWKSSDDVKIRISSALVQPENTVRLARNLAKDKPFQTWLPNISTEDGMSEFVSNDREEMEPIVVVPTIDPRLDGLDPHGSKGVAARSKLGTEFLSEFGVMQTEQFGRAWSRPSGREVLWSEAWGQVNEYDDERSESGTRLLIDIRLLKSLLRKQDRNLLILVELERYEKETFDSDGGFSYTQIVVSVDQNLRYKVHWGFVNFKYETDY
jgi:hypothetical protein